MKGAVNYAAITECSLDKWAMGSRRHSPGRFSLLSSVVSLIQIMRRPDFDTFFIG